MKAREVRRQKLVDQYAEKRARLKPWLADNLWTEPLVDEILHIAGTIYSKTRDEAGIWDNICIGSDFDGMITPIEAYPNANSFPKLDRMIYVQLRKRMNTEPFLTHKSDSDIREITDKIMLKNALRFLEKHYK